MTPAGNPLDLDRYRGALQPTPEVLADLHLAHVRHIPFVNLNVLPGHGIRLGPGELFDARGLA